MYEYSIALERIALKPELLGTATKRALLNSLGTELIRIMDVAQKSLKTCDGGGWEILSHDLTRLDRHLVVSFLIRRQK